MEVNITINGADHASDVEPRTLLVDHIRRTVGLTGTHVGCDTTSCGACTVLMDGKPVKAEDHGPDALLCAMMAFQFTEIFPEDIFLSEVVDPDAVEREEAEVLEF